MMQRGPCVKQVVTATIITPDGRRYVGRNDCNNAQKTCPRADMPTGMGYELCRDICQQPGHAEIQALAAAGDADLSESSLYLEGHTYVCAPCMQAVAARGVILIEIGSPPLPSGEELQVLEWMLLMRILAEMSETISHNNGRRMRTSQVMHLFEEMRRGVAEYDKLREPATVTVQVIGGISVKKKHLRPHLTGYFCVECRRWCEHREEHNQDCTRFRLPQ